MKIVEELSPAKGNDRFRRLSYIINLQNAVSKAVTLGYFQLAKNKDNNSWTQPKDQFTKKVVAMGQKSNIYNEELFLHERMDTETNFITTEEYNFVKTYGDEHF